MPTKLTHEILSAAIDGFEAQKERIDARIAELREQLAGIGTAPATVTEATAPRRRLSAAARRRIAAAQRRRWAEARQQAGGAAAKQPARQKRRLSPEGRRRIIEATKKRWAMVRAQKAVAARKKSAPAKKASKTATKAPAVKAAGQTGAA